MSNDFFALPGGWQVSDFTEELEKMLSEKPKAYECSHDPVSFGSKRGYCKHCDADMIMDDNMQWKIS